MVNIIKTPHVTEFGLKHSQIYSKKLDDQLIAKDLICQYKIRYAIIPKSHVLI